MPNRIVRRVLAGVIVLLLGACTMTPPPTIIVAGKDTRLRWETDTIGHRAHPITGRTQEIRREEVYREYWVKAEDGEWYRVSRADWEAALIGKPLAVRPALPERVTQPSGFGPCIGLDARWRC